MSRKHRSCGSSGSGSGGQSTSLIGHMRQFIGETVIIFTTNGGASGFGFTGIILSVNSSFVRLVTDQGIAPTNPLSDNVFGDTDSGGRISGGIGRIGNLGRGTDSGPSHSVGSVVDIPVNRIVAFTHNAI